jgi:hypothetical protein
MNFVSSEPVAIQRFGIQALVMRKGSGVRNRLDGDRIVSRSHCLSRERLVGAVLLGL